MKFKAEGREFTKILRSLKQVIQTVKGYRMLFERVPGGFSYLIEQLEFKLEKVLGFRNIQEKLGKYTFPFKST